ncbi:DUF6717 family protein [Chloroflexota bacterium]
MTNSIMVIIPYWEAGTWVFDDESVGLRREPFVMGIPDMINEMVRDISNARNGFRLLFSPSPFPGYQVELEWIREEYEGNWYQIRGETMEGWLCPAMFKYFLIAPKFLFAKAEALEQQTNDSPGIKVDK